ncbi:HD-GYP domain-containing protein [Virgibacillus kekensis]|uniref:HD-GYP domain-containing protein n=1 Tax=Virgibacillus kekensis TaxID=202261 RepID=A0ABV9DPJ1_9BACI
MQNTLRKSTLLNEEKRTTIWFLWLFYVIYFLYDITYYYIIPLTPWDLEAVGTKFGIGSVLYIIILGLLPLAYFLLKTDNPWPIKYLFFLIFTLSNIVTEILFYSGNSLPYTSGNIVEIVIVLFSPIFVNKKFFYLVSLGTIFKFVFVGLAIQDPIVIIPLLLVVILSMIAYILLHRFLGFVSAIESSYGRQLEGIVKGIIATLELKDPYTRGHSERVAEYALSLAETTNEFKDSDLKFFYYSCLLHDIGKINIPDSILSKPGRLTKEEFDVIKTHPVVGAKAVQQVEGISDNIDVIRHHHERWDGKGYPDGLKDKETSYLARITAIADAFDAMTSSRSYRAALPLNKAYQQIIDGKGTQFDPELVELFDKVYPTWVKYHKNYHASDGSGDEAASTTQRG